MNAQLKLQLEQTANLIAYLKSIDTSKKLELKDHHDKFNEILGFGDYVLVPRLFRGIINAAISQATSAGQGDGKTSAERIKAIEAATERLEFGLTHNVPFCLWHKDDVQEIEKKLGLSKNTSVTAKDKPDPRFIPNLDNVKRALGELSSGKIANEHFVILDMVKKGAKPYIDTLDFVTNTLKELAASESTPEIPVTHAEVFEDGVKEALLYAQTHGKLTEWDSYKQACLYNALVWLKEQDTLSKTKTVEKVNEVKARVKSAWK